MCLGKEFKNTMRFLYNIIFIYIKFVYVSYFSRVRNICGTYTIFIQLYLNKTICSMYKLNVPISVYIVIFIYHRNFIYIRAKLYILLSCLCNIYDICMYDHSRSICRLHLLALKFEIFLFNSMQFCNEFFLNVILD